jgi:DNA-binding NarL/FixJ family response regulator
MTTLREAVNAAVLARGALRGNGADKSVETWRDLCAGYWSFVDRFDGDGRHHLVARRNSTEVSTRTALVAHEHHVVGYAALGYSNKLIAHELGLPVPTVAGHVVAALRKLGVASRCELVRVAVLLGSATAADAPTAPARSKASICPPVSQDDGLRIVTLTVEGEDFLVVSVPLPTARELMGLPRAEREVLVEVLAGSSNAEIARKRGIALRTVVNQVASIFCKFGVHSRTELAVACSARRNS